MYRITLALTLALFSSIAPTIAQQEIKIYPPADKAVGAMTSVTEGRWIVFRAAPFGVVGSQTVTVGGQSGCLWVGDAGTYTAVLIPIDETKPVETGTVVLGEGEPKPDPKPDPDPSLEIDGLTLIIEQATATAWLDVAVRELRGWILDTNIRYKHYDPDQPAAQPFMPAAREAGLPAMIMTDGPKIVKAIKFPPPGETLETGLEAGDKAIKIVKDAIQ